MAGLTRALAFWPTEGARALWPRGREAWLRIALGLSVGALLGWVAAPPSLERKAPKGAELPITVSLGGEALPIEGELDEVLERARAISRRALTAKLILRLPAGAADARGADRSQIVRTREEFGAQIHSGRLSAMVEQLRDPSSALRRQHAAGDRNKPLQLPLPIQANGLRATERMLTLKDEVDRPPVDAKYSLEKRSVSPDVAGRRLDVYATMRKLDEALASGAAEFDGVMDPVPAQRTAEMLGKVEVSDVLGYFETKYSTGSNQADRTYNLRLAASRLDGHVILPGEVFDFNDVVGPRSEAYGYREATVIASGELVDGIGGGTCQISGTLHGAAFFGGLDIVHRRPHTRPSGYIKMGMDATVVYPTITLKLRNSYPFPVVLHEVVKDGVVRAEVLGPRRTRDVTYVRRIDAVTPFKVREIPDSNIPKGEKVLAQRGIPGFRVTKFRVTRDGPFAVRERMPDSYPSTAQIVRVGTGPANPDFVPRDDNHSEYVADEVLTISQGPSIRNNWSQRGGGMVESRVAGRYGSYGWTVREGLTTEWKRDPKPGANEGGE